MFLKRCTCLKDRVRGKREKTEKEIYHLLAHFPNGHKPGAWSSIWCPSFPMCRRWIGSGAARDSSGRSYRCQHHWQWLHLLYHNASPGNFTLKWHLPAPSFPSNETQKNTSQMVTAETTCQDILPSTRPKDRDYFRVRLIKRQDNKIRHTLRDETQLERGRFLGVLLGWPAGSGWGWGSVGGSSMTPNFLPCSCL